MRGTTSLSAARRALAACALLLLLSAGVARAGPVPPKPEHYVTDASGVLSPEARDALDARLAAFDRETTNQILVWIAPHVPEGTTPEELGADAIRAWGVGQAGRDNGIVLFVFTQDRKTRIATGYGMEGAVPDAVARRILAEQVRPHLSRGDFDGGIRAGVDALVAAARSEPAAPAEPSAGAIEGGIGGARWAVVALVGILFAVAVARRAPAVVIVLVAFFGGLVNLLGFFVDAIPTWFLLLFLLPLVVNVLSGIRSSFRWAANPWSGRGAGSLGDSSSWSSSGFDTSDSSGSSDSSDFSGGGGDSGGGGASDDF